MNQAASSDGQSQNLHRLEVQVSALIELSVQLREENRSLREQQDALMAERARLIEHSELARTRVEAMVNRLKAMEQ